MKRVLREALFENTSYKVASLFIALLLWVTLIGRRDFIYTKTMNVEIKTAAGMSVATQTADRIRVRVSGSRAALKKYMETGSQPVQLDISDQPLGVVEVDIPPARLDLPPGVRLLSVRPNVIRAEVVRAQDGKAPQ